MSRCTGNSIGTDLGILPRQPMALRFFCAAAFMHIGQAQQDGRAARTSHPTKIGGKAKNGGRSSDLRNVRWPGKPPARVIKKLSAPSDTRRRPRARISTTKVSRKINSSLEPTASVILVIALARARVLVAKCLGIRRAEPLLALSSSCRSGEV